MLGRLAATVKDGVGHPPRGAARPVPLSRLGAGWDDARMTSQEISGASRGNRRGLPPRRKEDIELGNSELRNLTQRRHEAEEKLEKHLKEQEAAHPKHPHHEGHPVLPEADAAKG